MVPLLAVVLVMAAANVATNRLPGRWYVPVCVLAAGCLLGLAWLDGLTAADIGLGQGTLLPGLAWAAVLVLLVALGSAAAVALPWMRPFFADRRITAKEGTAVVSRVLVAIPFGTVTLEETAFRAVLFGMVGVRHGSGWAVAVSSVLFGLWHVLPALPMYESNDALRGALGSHRWGRSATVLLTVVGTGLAGIGFALLRLWTNSVLPPAGLHWALNGMGVAVVWWLSRLARDRP